MRAIWTPLTVPSGSPASFLWPQFGVPLVAYTNQQAEDMGMSQAQLKELGRLVHRERVKAKWTQRGLADKAGVTHPTILRLERGDFNRPDPEKLQRIANALDVGAGDFFALAGYMHPDHLPSLGQYLRTKFEGDLSAKDRKEIERYVEQKRAERRKSEKTRARSA
jgi:transcriptional regulator with XRE-family HTH domain